MSRTIYLAALLLLATLALAQGHSTLQRAEPGDGALLKAPPNELRMWFTEPIKVGLSTIEVRNEAGKQVDGLDPRPDRKDPALVHLSLVAGLRGGAYRVIWTAVAQDMHVSKGSFTFRVAP